MNELDWIAIMAIVVGYLGIVMTALIIIVEVKNIYNRRGKIR